MQDSQFYNDMLSKMEEKSYRFVIKDIFVRGFRKGKIPRNIIARNIPQVSEHDRKKLFSSIFGSSLEPVGNKKAKFHEITNVTGIS